MALDKNGTPIPVYVPPLPPPPGLTPMPLSAPDPDIENDVGILKGEMLAVQGQVHRLELTDFEVGKLTRRMKDLEQLSDEVMAVRLRQDQLEIPLNHIDLLRHNVGELAMMGPAVATIPMLAQRIKALETQLVDAVENINEQLAAIWERLNVDPV